VVKGNISQLGIKKIALADGHGSAVSGARSFCLDILLLLMQFWLGRGRDAPIHRDRIQG